MVAQRSGTWFTTKWPRARTQAASQESRPKMLTKQLGRKDNSSDLYTGDPAKAHVVGSYVKRSDVRETGCMRQICAIITKDHFVHDHSAPRPSLRNCPPGATWFKSSFLVARVAFSPQLFRKHFGS